MIIPSTGAQEQNALPVLTRGFAAPPSTTGSVPDTPLTQIMPKLVMIPRQVVSTAFNMTTTVVAGAATSGAIKSMVTSFAEKVSQTGATHGINDNHCESLTSHLALFCALGVASGTSKSSC